MADELLKTAQDWFEGEVDFEGQKKVELISTLLLCLSGFIAFITGIFFQNIHITLWVGLAGTAITFLVVLPAYPCYNRSPEAWLPGAGAPSRTALEIEVDGKKISHS